MMDIIEINGEKYVKVNNEEERYCIVRTYSAGVFAGFIDISKIEGKTGTVRSARRLWSWSGAASLSELAQRGTSDPSSCKFPCEVDSVLLTEIIEVIPCTAEAIKSIKSVPIWSA